MTARHPTAQQPPARTGLSRRGTLGLVGATALTTGGALALATSAQATTPPGPPPPALLPGGAFEKYVSGLAADDQFSGTVLMAWYGTPTLVRSYREADKARNIPNRAGTLFPLASVSKFLTGVAATQLAEQGKIDFYATLGTYLDGFPPDVADVVTVHHLLTHTSGIPDLPPAQDGQPMTRTAAFEHELALLRQQHPVFTPGTRYADTSANYFLAGAIVAAASGEDFWDYLPRHVFGPAGMASTAFYSDRRWRSDPRFAHVYGPPVDGRRQDLTSEFNDVGNGISGASGAFSSAPDLLRFANALADGRLLAPEWAEVRGAGKYPLTPDQHDSGALPGPFLLGYGSEERITAGGRYAYGHQGEFQLHVSGSSQLGGLMAMLMIYPDLGVTAVALTNYYLNGGEFVAQVDRIVTAS
jgi:CubicO group peptidase (beta-lactamase class C family)